ncbi:putative protein kinase RLK-Pelle-DLSV family [Helianthus annuus]|uniref:Protein kinase domain-containing protein n=1 Tax=Helianthus annuus TaxID=4232 RepID=A0A9K3P266_HELAN|nr:putative protein kinase RLK-Pelle-DLSV family [Helianthus annuus]KAJ0787175.1 putative protein kinase RLK-Pelle-DLSV family [Helianthus annuus]KAJ0941064.1 putative protein kinase RLK-Pelle-DLSV family [Helianthus annuus]
MFQRQFSITFVTLFCVDFEIPISRKRIEVGLIVGTVGGGLFFVFLIMVILWRKGYIMGGKVEDRELTGIDLQTGIFTLRQLKRATNDFDPSNKLGEGGFGSVFKGLLSDGTIIAVKQLSSQSKQGAREFVNEIGMITALRHPNLVRLYGCCVEGNQMSLIYEYMANNCLSRSLLGEICFYDGRGLRLLCTYFFCEKFTKLAKKLVN